jgi:hypothetical protein
MLLFVVRCTPVVDEVVYHRTPVVVVDFHSTRCCFSWPYNADEVVLEVQYIVVVRIMLFVQGT